MKTLNTNLLSEEELDQVVGGGLGDFFGGKAYESAAQHLGASSHHAGGSVGPAESIANAVHQYNSNSHHNLPSYHTCTHN